MNDYKLCLCLIATSGDMSKRGMGNTNSIYLFDNKHKKLVDDFLKAQLNYELNTLEEDFPTKQTDNKKYYDKYADAFYKLQDKNIFTCKYDFRSHWIISVYDKDELKMYEPYQVEKNIVKK
tara:strand:+ start:169 stop:531 length:363 start_codon:yes stop_codon:yes gene_type:complete